MSLTPIGADEVICRLDGFDAIIDARSEDEFAQDHLPQAINWPTLDNLQRQRIGTLYKQVNPFEARKRGAAMAARNIAAHIEREVIDKPKDWQPLAYCWRGGQRSGALALILSQIGFRVTLLEGGYKAFRAAILRDIERIVPSLRFQVVCGPTGSGKTRLLQALAALGAPVLDLEALASHRSSVLGAILGLPQPSQKRFDTLVWDALRRFDASQPIYVESESKKVGDVVLPTILVNAMRQSPCLNLQLPDPERVALLMEDYAYLAEDVGYLCDRLAALTVLRGRATVERWQTWARSGELTSVVEDLLSRHYDPSYLQSMQRNFSQFKDSKNMAINDRSPAAMADLAQQIIDTERTR
ncbi:MAG: tRNA 2-selenouridine(34) synthase MnmH [Rhodoferax sp.]